MYTTVFKNLDETLSMNSLTELKLIFFLEKI